MSNPLFTYFSYIPFLRSEGVEVVEVVEVVEDEAGMEVVEKADDTTSK